MAIPLPNAPDEDSAGQSLAGDAPVDRNDISSQQDDVQQMLKKLQDSIATLSREIRDVCLARITECVAMQQDLAVKLGKIELDENRVRSSPLPPLDALADSSHIRMSVKALDTAPRGTLFRNERSPSGKWSRSSGRLGSQTGRLPLSLPSLGTDDSATQEHVKDVPSDLQKSRGSHRHQELPTEEALCALGSADAHSPVAAWDRADNSENAVFASVCPTEPKGIKGVWEDCVKPALGRFAPEPLSTEVVPFMVQELEEELRSSECATNALIDVTTSDTKAPEVVKQQQQQQQPKEQQQQGPQEQQSAHLQLLSETKSAGGVLAKTRNSATSAHVKKFHKRVVWKHDPSEEIEEEEDELEESHIAGRKRTGAANRDANAYLRRNIGKTQDVILEDHASTKPLEGPLVYRIVKHTNFDLASGLLILFNTAFVGCETDFMARHHGNSNDVYANIRHCFNVFFTIELALRILAERLVFFTTSSDLTWNYFDLAMVFSSWLEIVFQSVNVGRSSSAGRVLRILRIVRITRAMRIGRILRYARTFRQIAYSLQSSIGTLFWAMVMIFLVVYCFAICFCQAVTEYRLERGDASLADDLSLYQDLWYGVPSSLFSLYLAMTGGRNWGEVVNPLMDIGWPYTALFIIFISLTFFGVLNVVTAIFVDSALQSQQYYKDLLIQESMLRKQLYTQHLRHVFEQIDADRSGCINSDEMEYFLMDPNLNQYLQSIDIFPNDARALFRLLDRDGSGEISLEEFCEGCLRLKGEAKSFDLHCLIFNNEMLQEKLDALIEALSPQSGYERPNIPCEREPRQTIGHFSRPSHV